MCLYSIVLFSTNSWSNKSQRNHYRYVRNHFHCWIWSQLLFVLSIAFAMWLYYFYRSSTRPACDFPHLSYTETSIISDADDTESSWIQRGPSVNAVLMNADPWPRPRSPIRCFLNKAAFMIRSRLCFIYHIWYLIFDNIKLEQVKLWNTTKAPSFT